MNIISLAVGSFPSDDEPLQRIKSSCRVRSVRWCDAKFGVGENRLWYWGVSGSVEDNTPMYAEMFVIMGWGGGGSERF